MNNYTVSFFGHREPDNMFEIENKVEKIVREMIDRKNFVEFLVGRDGEFDMFVSSIIRRVKKAKNYGNSAHILILPYMTAEYRDNEESFREYYDEIEICAESDAAHFKSAFQIRNRQMVDRSDLVIFWVEHKRGGAYQTMRYAEKIGKKIINLANEIASCR